MNTKTNTADKGVVGFDRRVVPSAWHWLSVLAVAVACALLLSAVFVVHASGQTVFAVVLLVVGALAVWTYTSPRSGALRYLFPGVAAALIFVVFPMLYTISIGFTNRSSTNLLDFEGARAQLLSESVIDESSRRSFTLHRESNAVTATTATTLYLVLLPPESNPADHAWQSAPITSTTTAETKLPLSQQSAQRTPALTLRETVERLPQLRQLKLQSPEGENYKLLNLREFAIHQPRYETQDEGTLKDRLSGKKYKADMSQGFFVHAEDGERLQPGFQVNIGLRHFTRLFTDARFREPFFSVFVWTVVFAAVSVLGAAALGLLLASLLSWEQLRGRGVYRLILFLPYAVPGFLSILVFKGLFNQNLGEVNLILSALFGVKPAWFTDPLLAKLMLVIVNVWLGFPYMMVLCSGLLQSIPTDLREASAELGAGPFTHFRRITLPLIAKPLLPLLIAAFAFNFNNFVLVSLLTGGRPDQADSVLPAGTTDILVSYTWRIAFNDSGQQYGLAAAISTLIFVLVAAFTLVQMRATRGAVANNLRAA